MKDIIYKVIIHAFVSFLLLSFSTVHAVQEFTNVYTFGDSFSYANTWSEFISKRYGFNYIQDKNGFAEGGGRTFDLINMLTNYNTKVQGFDSNALYMIFFGPSDSANSFNHQFFGGTFAPDTDLLNYLNTHFPSNQNFGYGDVINLIKNGNATTEQVFPITINDVNNRATFIGNFVNEIASKGANYIVLLNMFNDILRQSSYINPSQVEFDIHQIWSDLYNKALYNKINELAPNANVIFIDNNRFITEVTSNPLKYFAQNDIAGTFRNNGFFDMGAHPTIAAQKLLSQYVASVIESPTRIAIVREIPLETGYKNFSRVRGLAENLIVPPERPFFIDFNGTYSNSNTGAFTNKQLGFKNGNGQSAELIFNYHTQANVSLGGQITANRNQINFVNGYGKARVDEYSSAAHLVYTFPFPLFVYSTLGFGKLDYNIERNIPLGTSCNSERGKTNGNHMMAAIGTGYRFETENSLAIIPSISVNHQQITIKRFTEKGTTRSTTMSFNIPKRTSNSIEIGTMMSRKFINQNSLSIDPFIGIRYMQDLQDSAKKQISGRVSDMPKDFRVPSYKVASSSLYIDTGISTNLRNNIFVSINTAVKPLGRVKQWMIGFSIKGNF